MRLGALLGPITDPANPQFIADQARTCAAEGFTSLWTAQATGRGFMMTDPLTTLTVAATVAPDVEVGTAVLQVPLYTPLDLAHRVASLAQLCGDRLLLGVGAGSTQADFRIFDRPFETRFADFRRQTKTLREILATGKSGDLDLSIWPPVLGRVQMLLGSWGKGVTTAAHDYDGWIASGHYRTPDEVCAAATRYRAAGGGRAIVSTIQVSGATDLGELRSKLAQFAAGGFDDAVLMFLPGAPAPGEIAKLI